MLPNEAVLVFPLSAPRAGAAPLLTPAQTPATADVVVAAQRGDRAAFAELYRTHVRMVHGVLLARVPRTDVDDLVQEVFLTAMRAARVAPRGGSVPRLAGGNRPQPRGRSLQARGPRRRWNYPDDLPHRATTPIEALAVLDAVRSLPDAYRETLILRLVEGMTGPEIAARTGLTEGSVRVNLHRGMKLLRSRLDGEAAP